MPTLLSSRTTCCIAAVLILLLPHNANALGEWKAGVATVTITPTGPLWMSGYGSRTKPSEGTEHDLWAKALAIEDPGGRRAVLR